MQTSEETHGSVPETRGASRLPTLPRGIEVNYDQLIADLRWRQSRPAYQEMLVSLVYLFSWWKTDCMGHVRFTGTHYP